MTLSKYIKWPRCFDSIRTHATSCLLVIRYCGKCSLVLEGCCHSGRQTVELTQTFLVVWINILIQPGHKEFQCCSCECWLRRKKALIHWTLLNFYYMLHPFIQFLVSMAATEKLKVGKNKQTNKKQADQHYNHTNILVCFIQLYPIIRLPWLCVIIEINTDHIANAETRVLDNRVLKRGGDLGVKGVQE